MQPAESEQVEEENGQKDETDREEISRQQKYFANMYLSQRNDNKSASLVGLEQNSASMQNEEHKRFETEKSRATVHTDNVDGITFMGKKSKMEWTYA